jgi:hypothetical protein
MSEKKQRVAKTKGGYWDEEMANKARQGGFYNRLGGKGGTLKITGAERMFKNEPNIVYVERYRVAGLPEDVENVLTAHGVKSSEVRRELAAAYNARNFKDNADFAREVAALKPEGGARRQGVASARSKAQAAALPGSIEFYAKQVEEAEVTAKPRRKARSGSASPKKARSGSASPKARKTTKKSTTTSKKTSKAGSRSRSTSPKAGKKTTKKTGTTRNSGARDLGKKIEKLAEGKVMDVSRLKADGTGAKVIELKENTRKIRIPGTNIVANDDAEGSLGVRNAEKQLKMKKGELFDAYKAARGVEKTPRTRKTKSGAASRSRSASRGRSSSKTGSRSPSRSRSGSKTRETSAQTMQLPSPTAKASSPGALGLNLPVLPGNRSPVSGGMGALPTVRAGGLSSPRLSPGRK